MSVCVVLVAHSGAAWLPQVLKSLSDQTITPENIVAVDTGSKDNSVEILHQALGKTRVVTAPRSTSFGEAIDLALPLSVATDWVWLLHDDSAPAPDALAKLLAAAEDTGASIIGPKLREWPSLRRLLEVGVTIGPTGQRETGLERGEYDQGQHDEIREVLAVNTAGMLVRRSVLEELGGFDRRLPIFGNDLDFGWRAATAGYATVVAPTAVVFHAEAASRGTRTTPLTGRHRHYQQRKAALFTLLANRPGRVVLFTLIRLFFGGLLRVAGLLLVRQPGQALDELAALLTTVFRPTTWLAARAERRKQRSADPAHVATLLAPWWLPYRHGLDFFVDAGSALVGHANEFAERKQSSEAAATRVDLDRPAEEVVSDESSVLWQWLTSPLALGTTAFLLIALALTLPVLGGLHTDYLPPTPERVTTWWQLWLNQEHELGLGSTAPAPPYVPMLALLGSLLGSPSAAVSTIVLVALPAGFLGMWQAMRACARTMSDQHVPIWLLVSVSASYVVVPAATGALQAGRLDAIVLFAVLPWLMSAVTAFADADRAKAWRAIWRAGLWLSIGCAFAPALWLIWVLSAGLVIAGLVAWAGRGVFERRVWLPPLLAALCPLLTLVSWWLPLVARGQFGALIAPLLDPAAPTISATDLMWLQLGQHAAPPIWLGFLLAVAVLAFAFQSIRVVTAILWLVMATAVGVLWGFSHLSLALPTGPQQPALVAPIVCVLTVLVLTSGVVWWALWLWIRSHPASVLRRVGAAAILPCLVVPLLGLTWWVGPGRGFDEAKADPQLPAYLVQSSAADADQGLLLLRADSSDSTTYSVLRNGGHRLGESEVIARSKVEASFASTVQTLLRDPQGPQLARLADNGIDYVVLLPPLDREAAATLDSAAGLAQASAEDRNTRAWDIQREVRQGAVVADRALWRTILVVLQALAITVVLVMAAPGRQAEER